MKQEDVTPEQFARWSFEIDQANVRYATGLTFDQLAPSTREAYLAEGKYYVEKHPKNDWPLDIYVKMQKV